MTVELLAERMILSDQVYLLRKGFDEVTEKVQKSSTLETHDKMEVLGYIANKLDEIVKQWPKLKDTDEVYKRASEKVSC